MHSAYNYRNYSYISIVIAAYELKHTVNKPGRPPSAHW